MTGFFDDADDWLSIGMDAWMLGAEASMVIALRSAKLAMGGNAAWVESQRMVAEKSAAHLELGVALAAGKLGSKPGTIASSTLAHYRKHVTANRRRLTKG